jgi:hypothetical protein
MPDLQYVPAALRVSVLAAMMCSSRRRGPRLVGAQEIDGQATSSGSLAPQRDLLVHDSVRARRQDGGVDRPGEMALTGCRADEIDGHLAVSDAAPPTWRSRADLVHAPPAIEVRLPRRPWRARAPP